MRINKKTKIKVSTALKKLNEEDDKQRKNRIRSDSK